MRRKDEDVKRKEGNRDNAKKNIRSRAPAEKGEGCTETGRSGEDEGAKKEVNALWTSKLPLIYAGD